MMTKLAYDLANESARVALSTFSGALGMWTGSAMLQRLMSLWGCPANVESVTILAAARKVPSALQ
eukprot:8263650-Karenia_brevis.AAC.1